MGTIAKKYNFIKLSELKDFNSIYKYCSVYEHAQHGISFNPILLTSLYKLICKKSIFTNLEKDAAKG